jgi:acyl-CoA thioester hydrolase
MRVPEGVYVASAAVRVCYVDTDRGGVMHHSTYLRYFEMARVEYMRSRNFDFRSLELDQGLSLVVVEANVRYRAGAKFDDLLEFKTWIGHANRAKLRFNSQVLRGMELLTTAEITCCCVQVRDGRLCSIPAPLIAFAQG